MARRQYADPRIVEPQGTRQLVRLPFTEQQIQEAWLQDLLFKNPSLLPVAEIEPAFGPLRAVAREMPTAAGPIDLVFVSPAGYLTVVETKLARNPEARREVLAQLLDYAKELSRWTYAELVDAIRRAGVRAVAEAEDPLLKAASGDEGSEDDEVDPREFQSTVSQGLRRGRFLLLIVGDEIREDVERLVGYLQTFAHLQFTMALVALHLYRMNERADWPLLVVPRVVARTAEIARTVVRIEGAERLPAGLRLTVGAEDERISPGLEAVWDALRGNPDAGSLDKLRSLLGALEAFGLEIEPLRTGVKVLIPDPAGSDQELRLLRIRTNGRVLSLGRLRTQLERQGYDGSIAVRYAQEISRWIPGTRANPSTGNLETATVANYEFPIRVLSEEHREEYLQLVAKTLDEIRAVATAKSARPA